VCNQSLVHRPEGGQKRPPPHNDRAKAGSKRTEGGRKRNPRGKKREGKKKKNPDVCRSGMKQSDRIKERGKRVNKPGAITGSPVTGP